MSNPQNETEHGKLQDGTALWTSIAAKSAQQACVLVPVHTRGVLLRGSQWLLQALLLDDQGNPPPASAVYLTYSTANRVCWIQVAPSTPFLAGGMYRHQLACTCVCQCIDQALGVQLAIA